MKLSLRVLIIFGILVSSCYGQINTVIDDFTDTIPYGDSYYIRPFSAKIEIVKMPKPLEEGVAKYTLFIKKNNDLIYLEEKDWNLIIRPINRSNEIISDTILIWPGPHKVGDMLTGEIRFLTYKTGFQGFQIRFFRGSPSYKVEVGWCIDNNGVVTYLGNPSRKKIECEPIHATFFNKDSVFIRGNKYPKKPFYYDISITPPFSVSDTSTIRYHIEAVDDLSDGLDLTIYSNHFEIIDYPKFNDYKLYPNDSIVIELKVVPLKLSNVHSINLDVDFKDIKSNRIASRSMRFYAILDDYGNLKYIDGNNPALTNEREELTSTSFRYKTRDILSKSLPFSEKRNKIDISLKKDQKSKVTYRDMGVE